MLVEFSLILFASSFLFSLKRRVGSYNPSTLDILASVYLLTMLVCAYVNFRFNNSIESTPYLISPGSLFSRTILPYSEYCSRILEPYYIILFFLLEYLSRHSNSKLNLLAKASFLFTWLMEVLHFQNVLSISPTLIHLLWASVFILYLLKIQGACPNAKRNASPFPAFLSFIFLAFSSLLLPPKPMPTLLSTHYYLWFPENWKAGYGDGTTDSRPQLGEYKSEDSELIKKHLEKISKSGINVLILDWWPRNPFLKKRALKVTEMIKEYPNLKFAIHLETLDLGLDKNSDLITMNDKRIKDLSKFFEYAGNKLFSSEQYLKVDERPVVFMYASRHLVGDVRNALIKVKEHTKETSSYFPYLIGDEVFYQVPEGRNAKSARLKPRFIPSWDRIMAFDALTLYNPYDPTHHYTSLEEGDTSEFLIESYTLYSRYKDICNQLGIPFLPTAIPAYNDKMIRPHLNHQIIPRVDKNGISTLDALLSTSEEFKNRRGLNLTTITSFNEWNEGTNIER